MAYRLWIEILVKKTRYQSRGGTGGTQDPLAAGPPGARCPCPVARAQPPSPRGSSWLREPAPLLVFPLPLSTVEVGISYCLKNQIGHNVYLPFLFFLKSYRFAPTRISSTKTGFCFVFVFFLDL